MYENEPKKEKILRMRLVNYRKLHIPYREYNELHAVCNIGH